MHSVAEAHPNIALVKYWGKRDARLNLPFRGSIAVTVAPLRARTAVTVHRSLDADQVLLHGSPADARFAGRVQAFLDLVREQAGRDERAVVETESDIPMAAGLAGSSAGFAALALAATRAYGLDPGEDALSRLARRGSGSACRSIHGGFVEWKPGKEPGGSDSLAIPLEPPDHWDIAIVIAVVNDGRKQISSREAMARTVGTSPLYPAWLRRVDIDLPLVRRAIRDRDLRLMGPVIERNCLAMFATMWTADPPILYWQHGTVEVMEAVRRLRARGVGAWFTIDAGPNVKVLCEGADRERVRGALSRVPGVRSTLTCRVGGAARRIPGEGMAVSGAG